MSAYPEPEDCIHKPVPHGHILICQWCKTELPEPERPDDKK